MKTEIKAHNDLLTDALSHYVTRRLDFALGKVSARVNKVTVRLSDINGPRGGIDKHCQVQVSLYHLPDIVVVDREADLYAAINRAIERASQTVMRKLGRHRRAKASQSRATGQSVMDALAMQVASPVN